MIPQPFIRTASGVAFLCVLLFSAPAFPAGRTGVVPVKAFLVTSLPDAPDHQEEFFRSLRRSGADTVLYPVEQDRLPDLSFLPQLVFAAHQARLRLFLVLPFRTLPAVLAEHPEWEDRRYDLESGTIQPAGRLDLFHPAAVEYLANLFGEIASYSVDGMFFAEDFSYKETEAMSPRAIQEFEQRYGKALSVSRAIPRTVAVEGGRQAAAFGEGYDAWGALRKERLVGALREVMNAARRANPSMVFGVPLHARGLGDAQDAFRRYGYDVRQFEEIPVDYYWIPLLHRRFPEKERRSYRRRMDELGRLAREAAAAVPDPSRLIIVLQTAELGRRLPFVEIEEARAVAAKAGGAALLAYTAAAEAAFPEQFIQKLFRR